MQDFTRNACKQSALLSALFLFSPYSVAHSFIKGHPSLDVGGYWSSKGISQTINYSRPSQADYYSVISGNGRNGLVGAGYYLNWPNDNSTHQLGLNFFYLPKTSVSGQITRQFTRLSFTNLTYGYSVTHYPLYVISKMQLAPELLPYSLHIDAGIGPNFIITSNYTETMIVGRREPNIPFAGKSSTTFSATAGLALEINLENLHPLACGYRFFYLGKGSFNQVTNRTENNLTTGNNYANAVLCTVSF